MSKRICLITDAWTPQVNGVVTTLTSLVTQLKDRDYKVNVIEPSMFKCFPLPSYNEIKVPYEVFKARKIIKDAIDNADVVHIATEGVLGLIARLYCHKHNIKYITSYHTKFPEYVNARLKFVSVKLGYKVMRWMHSRSEKVLVTTRSMQMELIGHGINNTLVWNRGVDTTIFRPLPNLLDDPDPPLLGYVGRVSVEKNIEDFLNLPDNLGRKVVIGDGPDLKRLKKAYPDVEFVGYKFGEELVEWYNRLHVKVFPSITDTFGLVNIEAMACGTPVAAYPVTGPIDIILQGVNGYVCEELSIAVASALVINRNQCAKYTRENHSLNAALTPYLELLSTL